MTEYLLYKIYTRMHTHTHTHTHSHICQFSSPAYFSPSAGSRPLWAPTMACGALPSCQALCDTTSGLFQHFLSLSHTHTQCTFSRLGHMHSPALRFSFIRTLRHPRCPLRVAEMERSAGRGQGLRKCISWMKPQQTGARQQLL